MTVFVADPNLLRRFRKGDRDALACVYAHYVGAIESSLRRYIVASRSHSPTHSVILRADLADLVQEVFIKAFSAPARNSYDGVREYRPFLLALSRNVLIDHLRSRGREVQMDVAAIEQLGDFDPSVSADEVPWADAKTMFVVEHYVNGLCARERAVYDQRYVLCRSQVEAAATLGLSRQQLRTMEAHLRRGLARELTDAKLNVSAQKAGVSPSRPSKPQPAPVAAEPERDR